jgi:hypothetical protein
MSNTEDKFNHRHENNQFATFDPGDPGDIGITATRCRSIMDAISAAVEELEEERELLVERAEAIDWRLAISEKIIERLNEFDRIASNKDELTHTHQADILFGEGMAFLFSKTANK